MKLTGKAVSQGIVIGRVWRYCPVQVAVTQTELAPEAVGEAIRDYEETLTRAKGELERLEARMLAQSPDKAPIVRAHLDILFDPAMEEEIKALIESRTPPDAAIDRVYSSYSAALGRSKNERMRERASDLEDVKKRLLRCWNGAEERDLSQLEAPVILVADDLYPSDTVSMDRTRTLGIVTQVGGSTSHTAIIARSYGIPAVLGVPNALELLTDGEELILDGVKGELILHPTEEERRIYLQEAKRVQAELRETATYLTSEPVMLDGTPVEVRLNVGAANEEELDCAEYADGCGLFRTEFLYLNGDHLPDEEEQYQIYKKVLLAFGGKSVILRTLDIGGDKQLSCMALPKENNPFLGLRGLRLCLANEELFRVQIRAALRASVYGKLQIMMPMVGALDEVRLAKALFAQERAQLQEAGIPCRLDVPIGIMIEVPSVALISDLVADEVDFVSVGTNDLCQYLTASDRMNAAVKCYHQDYHPAMFRTLGYVAKSFGAAERSVSVCGELGGDPLAIPALVGLGIHKLSMGRTAIAGAKRVIRGLRMEECRQLAEKIQHLKTEGEIRTCLEEFAAAHKN